MRFISKHPLLTALLLLALACYIWTPRAVGAWLGSAGHDTWIATTAFVGALVG